MEKTILLNKTMFDDRMYLKTGFTGKDLGRAVLKFGIDKERKEKADKEKDAQIMKMVEHFKAAQKAKEEQAALTAKK